MPIPEAPCTTAVLKVHVDPRDGTVWLMDGAQAPCPTGLDAGAFACGLDGNHQGPVRLLASRSNAPLIADLSLRYGDDQVVEVGRPGYVDWAALAREGPAAILLAIHQLGADAPSRGGWHRLGRGEAVAYEAAAYPDCFGAAEMAAGHPAWPALAFVTHLDGPATARLIATILDPRWFVDPNHPDRSARLKSFLGLDAVPCRGSAARRERRRTVAAAWGPFPQDLDPEAPGAFLWRYWLGNERGSPQAAGLAVSRHFLDYLRWTWLDAVSPLRKGWACPHDQGLFVPEHFFKKSLEQGGGPDYATAAAFRRHMAAVPGPPVN